MTTPSAIPPLRSARLLVAGLVAVIVVLALALVVLIVPRTPGGVTQP